MQQETFVPFKKHSVFVRQWLVPKPLAHLLVIHGLGEHSGSYDVMCKALNEHNISCYAIDLIGHGQSSGQRGYVPSLDEFVAQVDHVSRQLTKDLNIDKLHVFSHSLGGLVHLKKIQNSLFDKQASAIFSNPLMGIKVEIPQWKIQLGKTVANVLPRLALFNEIKNEDLTKDPLMDELYTSDPLRHNKISARLFIEMQDYMQELEYETPTFNIPTMLLLSPSDKICDSEKSQNFFSQIENLQLELFPQSGHEIVNDLSKQHAFDLMAKFILGAQS